MKTSAHICQRIAIYVWTDRFNRVRTSTHAVPDDMHPRTLMQRHGIQMKLKAVLSREDVANADALDALAAQEARRIEVTR